MRGIWPMDTKPLSQVMVERQMEVFQSVVMAIRKIKSSMRVKNTDQIRIDAVLPEDELMLASGQCWSDSHDRSGSQGSEGEG